MILDQLPEWAPRAAAQLAATLKTVGGVVELVAPMHPNSSFALNVEAPHSFAQMNVWATGQVDVLVLDADSDLEAINRTETVTSEDALQNRLEEFGALLLERSLAGKRSP